MVQNFIKEFGKHSDKNQDGNIIIDWRSSNHIGYYLSKTNSSLTLNYYDAAGGDVDDRCRYQSWTLVDGDDDDTENYGNDNAGIVNAMLQLAKGELLTTCQQVAFGI